MASIQERGDKFLAQVRIKRAGVIIFSESRVFDTRPLAKTCAERVEEEVRSAYFGERDRSFRPS
jgi:hypothetical protein